MLIGICIDSSILFGGLGQLKELFGIGILLIDKELSMSMLDIGLGQPENKPVEMKTSEVGKPTSSLVEEAGRSPVFSGRLVHWDINKYLQEF
jgi:hypothetical protein